MRNAILAIAMLTVSSSALAEDHEETFGDWFVSYRPNTGASMSFVSNNAGALFGTICTRNGCEAFLDPKIACEEGSEYPALVNAPSSAFHVRIRCAKLDKGDTYYVLPLEGSVADAMSVGGVLGIAFPMQSGQFKVERFP